LELVPAILRYLNSVLRGENQADTGWKGRTMKLQLELVNGEFREVVVPSFPTLTEQEQFQNFLSHFKVNGSMIDTEGRGIPYHAVLEVVRKKEEGVTS
jgi:hypothetical protein